MEVEMTRTTPPPIALTRLEHMVNKALRNKMLSKPVEPNKTKVA